MRLGESMVVHENVIKIIHQVKSFILMFSISASRVLDSSSTAFVLFL